MNIIIFGASGGTGREVVKQALEAGHLVTAFMRTPSKVNLHHPNLRIFQGDVMDAPTVDQAIAGQDVVISTLGPTRPPVPRMMETAARNIITAMNKHGLRRLIATTGAGVRQPEDQPKLMDTFIGILLNLLARKVVRDSAEGVRLIQSSHLDWTIVRFPRLKNGPHTGKYRVGYVSKESSTRLSRADAADFIVKELTDNGWLKKLPLVSY